MDENSRKFWESWTKRGMDAPPCQDCLHYTPVIEYTSVGREVRVCNLPDGIDMERDFSCFHLK